VVRPGLLDTLGATYLVATYYQVYNRATTPRIQMVTTTKDPLRLSEFEETEDVELSPRDTGILQAIQEEGLTVFSFDGLKRLVGVHQEMLSRILGRLEDDGLLERVPEGYRLTSKSAHLLRPMSLAAPRVPIVQSLLPQDINMQEIIAGLKGRWFGSLRWLGYTQNEDGTTLKWITDEDNVQIDAKFTETYLSIDAKIPEGKDSSKAVRAAHQLLGYVSRLYGGPQRPKSFARPVIFYDDLEFA
jgi:hypothetical protein